MDQMFNRPGRWWRLWMMLAVMWTIVSIAFGWMNLPRAQHIPHDPQFLNKLSNEASSILRGTYVKAKPARGALVWSENPKIVRMSNDTLLEFPATTTDERAEIVASEYRQLLNVEADKQIGPYLLEMLAIWLVPAAVLLVIGIAGSSIYRGSKLSRSRSVPGGHSPYSIGRAFLSMFVISGTGDRTDGDSMPSNADHPVLN